MTGISKPMFRVYVLVQSVSSIGTAMDYTAVYWLMVSREQGKATDLTILVISQFLPILMFSRTAGTLCRRYSRARVLSVTQLAQASGALAIAVRLTLGNITPEFIWIVAFLIGSAQAIDVTARQAFFTDILPGDSLRKGMSIYSASTSLSKIGGPAIAGSIISTFGAAPVFYVNAASFVGVIVTLRFLGRKLPERADHSEQTAQTRWLNGLSRPTALAIFGAFLIGTFGYQFEITNPLMATDVFRLGAVGYGLFGTFLAGGAILGNLYSSRRKNATSQEFIKWTILFGAAEIAASAMPGPVGYDSCLIIVGAALSLFSSSALVFIQQTTPQRKRADAISAYNAAYMGFVPVGALVVGATASIAGSRWSIAGPGVIIMLTASISLAMMKKAGRSSLTTAEATATIDEAQNVKDHHGVS